MYDRRESKEDFWKKAGLLSGLEHKADQSAEKGGTKGCD